MDFLEDFIKFVLGAIAFFFIALLVASLFAGDQMAADIQNAITELVK